jgi:hypothetical protein
MNLFDYFGDINAFGAAPDARAQSLLDAKLITPEAIEAANKRSIGTGIMTGLASYFAQPKTGNYGSALPYIGKAYLNANKAAQVPFQGIADKYLMDTKIAENKKALEVEAQNKKFLEELLADERVQADPLLKQAAINNPVKVFEVLNKPTTRPNNAQRYSDLLTIKNQSQIPNSGISFSKTQEAELNALAKTLKVTNPIAPTVAPLLDLGYNKISTLQPLAESAPRNITRYQKYKQAIEADKTFMGLQTDLKTDVGRIASFFGVGGADLNEKLANTKEIVQQMANRQLDAGSKLKGMPSDKEQALLQKAAGANYDNMTPAELVRVIELAIADEEYIIKNYNGTIDIVYKAEQTNPNNNKDSLSILDSFRVNSPNKTVVVDY